MTEMTEMLVYKTKGLSVNLQPDKKPHVVLYFCNHSVLKVFNIHTCTKICENFSSHIDVYKIYISTNITHIINIHTSQEYHRYTHTSITQVYAYTNT